MKRNKDYIYREIVGEPVLVPTGEASEKLNGMIRLTETAAFIWNHVDECDTMEEIAGLMTDEYEVEYPDALTDVQGFLGELIKRNIVTE